MANIASSKKDARQSAVRAIRNRAIKSSVKTKVSKFRRAAADGEAPEGQDLDSLGLTALSALDRAVAKGVLHRNNAGRRKARLVKRLNALTAEAPAEAARPARTSSARKAASKPAPSKTRTGKSAPAAKPGAKPATKAPAKKK
ncbi:MAG: 30S ribosomal protein S20 [Candidatus Dormibacter sp.]|uniref:30S ribosomal protein S20 n=1 Tax=Candidatus Dormibacter sp. TaxID=2973982 RepID=UPI000DB2563D|nr:MAG: 30S ribosomal protein S20 [Candidatus Dormibacteraeota bacterium]